MPKPSNIDPVYIRPDEWLQIQDPPLGVLEGYHHGANCVIIRYSTDTVGEGPNLHVHPYDEIFHIIEGRAQFTVGDRTFEAEPAHSSSDPRTSPMPTRTSAPDALTPSTSTSTANGYNTICPATAKHSAHRR